MANDAALALPTQIPEDIKQMAALIKAMLPNGNKLTDQEAIAGAMYGKAKGLDVFKQEFYIIPGKGIYPGYRGEMKENQNRDYYTQTRPLRQDEAEEHEIMPGDSARIVEVYEPTKMATLRVLGMTYQPIIGVGIVRKAEKYKTGEWKNGSYVRFNEPQPTDPPTGRSWAWKAEQRALKDAMRHMQGGPDILDETVEDALQQAEDHADTVAGEFRALPPETQAKQFDATVTTMRGEAGFEGFGDDEPKVEDGEFTESPATLFDNIPSATEERAAEPPKTQAVKKPATVAGNMQGAFGEFANDLAKRYPSYQMKDGATDKFHVLMTVASLGYLQVNATDWDAIKAAVEAHAENEVLNHGRK